MKYNQHKKETVPMHTVSSPQIRNTITVTTSQRNNGGISNAGTTMPPAHPSLKHGERSFMAKSIDPERLEDPVMDADSGC